MKKVYLKPNPSSSSRFTEKSITTNTPASSKQFKYFTKTLTEAIKDEEKDFFKNNRQNIDAIKEIYKRVFHLMKIKTSKTPKQKKKSSRTDEKDVLVFEKDKKEYAKILFDRYKEAGEDVIFITGENVEDYGYPPFLKDFYLSHWKGHNEFPIN